MSGLFLVLEGGEGAGKTTQWGLLSALLRSHGHKVLPLREPGGTRVGDGLRALLLNTDAVVAPEAEALMFLASRAQLVAEVIEPALAGGVIVLADRFLLSTYAYQGAGRQLSLESLRLVNAFAARGVVPDLTMLLSLPMAEAMARAEARGAADRIEREPLEFHRRVADAFSAAATTEYQEAHREVGPVELVDAGGTEDAVLGRLASLLAKRWPARFSSIAAPAALNAD